MGKVATAEMNQLKRKRGRPPKNPLSTPPNPINYDSTNRRSTRRNPNYLNSPPEFDDSDDDDERREKKSRLVGRLPQSGEKPKINRGQHNLKYSQENYSSASDPESEDRDAYAKKRKINAVDGGSDDIVSIQEKKAMKATETPVHGSASESGPTAPLPDKKLLVFILDRIQKKDTYGVFSEAVDPDELPDYFEIIEQPMDFGTVRKKLESGAYKKLEELEADVFLICSNAMEYNAPDTVYYRQARSIEELAKRDFANLKREGDDGEPQPKVVRRGRPPGIKNQKKPLESSPVDRVAPKPSSGATLSTREDKAMPSNSYNLRKTPALSRFRSTDTFMSSHHPRNGENYTELLVDWNEEFPASILRADMKYGKKQFTVDENRRDTYNQFHPLSSGSNPPGLSNSIGVKRLVQVGLQEPLAYARSLAKFAANLGPLAWKIASKKIEAALPATGVQYGPGWVGDNGTPSQQKSLSCSAGVFNESQLLTPASDLSSHGAMVETVRKLNSQNEQVNACPWRTTQFPSQQKPLHQQAPHRNTFTGNMPEGAQMDMNEPSSSHYPAIMNQQEAKLPEYWSPGFPVAQVNISASHREAEMWKFGKSSWQLQQRHSLQGPPDLNVAGSPHHQPDLALQL